MLAFWLFLHLLILVPVWHIEGLLYAEVSARHCGLPVISKTRSLPSITVYIINSMGGSKWKKKSSVLWVCEEKRKHNLDGVKKRERAHPVVFWETSGRGTVWSLPRSWGRNLLCKCKICFFILSYFAVLHSRFRDFCFKYGWEKDLIRDVCCSWASLSSTPPPPPGLCSTPHPVIKYQPFAAHLWCGFVMPLRGWH